MQLASMECAIFAAGAGSPTFDYDLSNDGTCGASFANAGAAYAGCINIITGNFMLD